MKRRTLADWKRILERQAESGQPISVFCKENNLPTSNFYKYRNKLAPNKTSAPFVKTTLINTKPLTLTQVLLTVGEVKLTINDNCSPNWLAQLIKALRA